MSTAASSASATLPPFDPVPQLATELALPPGQIAAAMLLFAQGDTIPFVARYRKEATGGLDEVQLRDIRDRGQYLAALDERRRVILASIGEQGKLTDALRQKLLACKTKTELEDLYLPYKKKRRTRAAIARERGLEPLAERILAQPTDGSPELAAAEFVDVAKEVPDAVAALAGARDIIAERVAENAAFRSTVRKEMLERGQLVSQAVPEKTKKPTKFEQYYDHREPLARTPSHRFLAIRRGEKAGFLKVRVELLSEPLVNRMSKTMRLNGASPFAGELTAAIEDGFKRLIAPSVETDVRSLTRDKADAAALNVFATNLRHLLLSAPLGAKSVLGIDPGLRTGCKCVALDSNGKLLEELTVYPLKGEGAQARAASELVAFTNKHTPFAIAIGNGTGGREMEALARTSLREAGLSDVVVVAVNESGASIYSASSIARAELPNLDVSVRGAVSIGRRLQDPLAELVKIDPKSIGVGQYQHDVDQPRLRQQLGEVVESCVNHVGVDLNTASGPLLAYVAGVGPALAQKVVTHRDEHGAFESRRQLLEVNGLGERTFTQAAGFLRVHGGKHPLDASAVHPERYELVEKIAVDLGIGVADLVGNKQQVGKIEHQRYLSDEVGAPTMNDIITELEKPGRDPRDDFEPPRFRDDVNSLTDLKVGMKLDGVVTNVTEFGAFVDVGVHQDGLVHKSKLSDGYIDDPSDVVAVGKQIQVTVLSIDLERQRVSLGASIPSTRPKPKPRPKKPKARADHKRSTGKPASAGSKTETGGGEHKGKRPHGARPSGPGGTGKGHRPRDGKPRDGKPRDAKPGGGKPGGGKPGGGKPGGGKPGGGKPGGGKPGGGKPGGSGKPRDGKPRSGGKPRRDEPRRDSRPQEKFTNNPFAILKKK